MKILVAEDDPVSRHTLEVFLRKWGYVVQAVADGAEALKALLEDPDPARLVVLDRQMPNVGGLDVCRAIRKGGAEPYTYVILLTGEDREHDLLEGFEAGADEYITKPFEARELQARVRTGARIVELQEQLIAAREELRIDGMHDSLTRALNRVAFFEIFDREVARARRKHGAVSLIMADVDHFTAINDRYGHPAGDAVLREVARRLRASLRATDAVGRYGGEEFIVVAPDCSVQEAIKLAERFRNAISASPIHLGDRDLQVTMSFGVAGTANMDEARQLLEAADAALYKAKESGRNRVAAA